MMAEELIEQFYQKTFNVEIFLNQQNETRDLNEILKSLLKYKNENFQSMSMVLKEQTESVIAIAEKLQWLEDYISKLRSPVFQLREEVMTLQRHVNSTVESFDKRLLTEFQIRSLKCNLRALSKYYDVFKETCILINLYLQSSDKKIDNLERIICNYAFQVHLLKQLNATPKLSNEDKVQRSLEEMLKEKLLIAFTDRNVSDLRRIIYMYLFSKKKDNLVAIIRDDIIRPLLEPILSEENLRKNGDNMIVLYNDTLSILKNDLKIFNAAMHSEKFRDFNLTLDCYWVIVDKLLRENLICITAAGHADIFFKHFTDTIQFLEELSVIYGDESLIRTNESFVRHIKRFNMLVYYEIRHQQVSSAFEACILQNSDFTKWFYSDCLSRSSKIYLKLQVSISLYIQLLFLFNPKIFIKLLSDQFLKSSFLLVSRYITWVDEIMEKNKTNDSEAQKFNLICLLCDLNSLMKHVASPETDVYAIIDGSTKQFLTRVVKMNHTNLGKLYEKVKNTYVTMTMLEVKNHLHNVTSIPRLYRRTNKVAPSDHSSYIVDAMRPLFYFQRYFDVENPLLISDHRHIMNEIIDNCNKEYLGLVTEVLTSVGKTEESLRRLKLRNTSTNDDSKNDANSDESKIRLQIKIDVACFVQEINKLVPDEERPALKELLQKSGN